MVNIEPALHSWEKPMLENKTGLHLFFSYATEFHSWVCFMKWGLIFSYTLEVFIWEVNYLFLKCLSEFSGKVFGA